MIRLKHLLIEQEAEQGDQSQDAGEVQQSSKPGLPELVGNVETDNQNASKSLSNYYNDGAALGAGDINKLVGKNVYLWSESNKNNQIAGMEEESLTFKIAAVATGTTGFVYLYSNAENYRNNPYVSISPDSNMVRIHYYTNYKTKGGYYYNFPLLETVRAFLKTAKANTSGTTKNAN